MQKLELNHLIKISSTLALCELKIFCTYESWFIVFHLQNTVDKQYIVMY